ncbi:hypothetical protein ACFWBF_03105 [Streptomyces sp. NPDC060028]|uniref:hypothetical protein n=1 Tax=Streptomyces sp. NPDC060028 TaxID=3347041 RepID=UPI0036788EED
MDDPIRLAATEHEDPGHEAPRAAEAARPVHEVGERAALLGEHAHEGEETDLTPRAAPRGSRALRHLLRWPVALALLVCGALHLPRYPAGVSAGDPGVLPGLAVAVLCLGLGALLAVRDTAAVWRTGAVAALAVAVLHVLGGIVGFDPPPGAVGGSADWTDVTAVLCAASAAVLAGLALQYRPRRDGT